MDLHLHLSVAFRALDRKWGKTVDLDYPEVIARCVPAVVDNETTTFSSEEYLKTLRRNRSKPYSRVENYGHTLTRTNIKNCDSFSNISIARVSFISGSSSDVTINSDLEQLSEKSGKTLQNGCKKGSNFLKQFKVPTLMNVKRKLRRICSRDKL
ncbi:hypothetical protein RR48_13616 [Papilio machaon]|uniref:Uncharacterized protein n=1 Tax=Papilio machaon TaxID=76193 RepID=A0A194RB98_PAPMA|nr:hypothetical protein RR48_13616 [Papilio machaon]